ncbi:hypothetical protein BIW11_12586 [Tropilaelaps mercedesae]|uniref:L antigen family member 3 n=1 Tax=Tropilaelaps mercedesae TaxID=418985 RepID=A0A1V9X5Q2_9ACAR|nr:hypothetical protein BIW11_12586 [Tropilaelaps mercedesae]
MSCSEIPEQCKSTDDTSEVPKRHSVTFQIPMKSNAYAKIVQASLQVDPEPERSRCSKTIEVFDCDLRVHITGLDMKNLRNASTNFFELFDLVTQTIEQFGKD